MYRLVQKTGLFIRVDYFAMLNGRKACDMSKVLEFCLEKEKNLQLVHFNILCLVCIDLHSIENNA